MAPWPRMIDLIFATVMHVRRVCSLLSCSRCVHNMPGDTEGSLVKGAA